MAHMGPRDGSSPEEFLRGPKWRTRTTDANRHRFASLTFALIVVVGVALVGATIWLLRWLGAPTWVASLPWVAPTVGALVWTLVRPRAAEITDDDDDSWFGYSIRWALVGELAPRPVPARIVSAVLFGAPVAWAVLVSGLLTLVGIV